METEQLMDEIDLILQTSKAGTVSTSVSPTVSEYMTFYIKDYALYTETEKNSPIINGTEHNLLVYITLGGDKESEDYLEIIGEAELLANQGVDDWLRQEKGPFAVKADMVIVRVMALKVKLVGVVVTGFS